MTVLTDEHKEMKAFIAKRCVRVGVDFETILSWYRRPDEPDEPIGKLIERIYMKVIKLDYA